jgi:hypothetical protein
MKPFYNECVLHEDKTQFKRPTEMSVAEYKEISSRHLWNANVKFSFFSISLDTTTVIRLCHLLMLTAFKLKVFGEDAFGKVATRCSAAANIINYILEHNRVYFPVTSGHQCVPARVKPISEEVFKSVICDLVKVCSDTALQWHYVGDGQGPPSVAGLGLPSSALTDGSQPSAEVLYCQCLHDVKGILDSKAYLKTPIQQMQPKLEHKPWCLIASTP